MASPAVVACHDCDLLLREPALPPGGAATCPRCGAVLYRREHESFDHTLAYLLAAAALFVIANAFPIVGLNAQGHHSSTTLLGTVRALHDDGMTSVAALVFVTAILMPAIYIGGLLYLLLPLRLGRVPRGVAAVFRVVDAARPWGMVEVFMLGLLVTLTKLAAIASVELGIALWSFAALMFLVIAAAASFDSRALWVWVEARR